MRKKCAYMLFLLLLAFPDVTQAKLFDGKEFSLDNGLKVIVLPNKRVPIVKHMVWYKAGAVDEPLGKGGIAHLLEHLMFRGTDKVSGADFNAVLEENGAESNAFTSADMTAYHQFLDRSRLELAMFLEADRMRNINLNEQAFETERKIVFEERKQRVDNNPVARFAETVNKLLWQDHPYGRPVSGTEPEILALKLEDARDFYDKYYAPNNAILVLSGDIDETEAKKLAEKYYGNLEASKIETNKEFGEVYTSQKTVVEISMPEIKGVRVVKFFAAPSYNKNKEDAYALSIWSKYLGEGETSALYKKLVLRDKKALAVTVDYDPAARDYGRFAISAIPAPGVSADELLKDLENAWDEAFAEFNETKAKKTKQKMLAGLIYLRDNPEDAAYIVGQLAVIGMPLAEIEIQDEKIKETDYQSILKAADNLKRQAPMVIGILKPEDKLK